MERELNHRAHPFLRGMRFFGFIILGAIAAAFFAFIFGYFVMLLWNWLMPTIFGLITITFWQAAGIVLLARLIFGGFKHGTDSHHKKDYHRKKFFKYHYDKRRSDRYYKDWKYFDDFWWDEGEIAYNSYIERKKEQEQK
jgi:hypothetical protein